MKQAATEKKTNPVKAKKQNKTSASVFKKAKMPKKSVTLRKSAAPGKAVSAGSGKPAVKSPAKSEVLKKTAPKKQNAESLDSVIKAKSTKSVSSKIAEKKVSQTQTAKVSAAQKSVKNTVSKKVVNTNEKKTKASLTVQKPKTVESKIQPAKPVSPKGPNNKTAEKKVQKPEKSPAKPKLQKPETVKTVTRKSLPAKPKVLKTKAVISEKSFSKSKKTVAAKPISSGKNVPAAAKKAKTAVKVSAPKTKKTTQKSPVKTPKTKAATAKTPVKPVQAKTAITTKTVSPKHKSVPKKSAAKAVSKPKLVKPEIKSKRSAKSSEPKVPAKGEPNGILKYAKPAITGKTQPAQKAATKIEIVMQPKTEPKISEEIKEAKKKPLRAISSAVFRGEKDSYSFKVYEIGENFKEIPAVYVISKRITDRRNRGHHKLICIGETESLLKDLKTHRKSKCLRSNKANVISILREDDKETRLKIENDLKAAHSIACNLAR